MNETTTRTPPAADDETIAFYQKVFQCVRSGDTAQVGPLLDHGMSARLRNERGDSFLMLAAYHGRRDMAELLLAHGADPEVCNDMGQTPLGAAAYKGDLAMVELLLERGAKVDGASPDGKTPLMFAAMFNRVAVLEALLAKGADPLAQEAKGMTALSLAMSMDAHDTVARLRGLCDGSNDDQAVAGA